MFLPLRDACFQMEHWGKATPILLDMAGKQDKMLEKQDGLDVRKTGFDAGEAG